MKQAAAKHIRGQTCFIYIKVRTTGAVGFFDNACYRHYLTGLVERLSDSPVKLHAWCLLPREICLLVTPATLADVVELLDEMNRSYSDYFNRRFDRQLPTVWSGHHSTIVGNDRLAFDCQKFIEVVAVRRAGLGPPGTHLWSSYSAHGFGVRADYLDAHPAYTAFIKSADNALARYRDFVAKPFPGGYESYLARILGFDTAAPPPTASPD